VVPPIGTPLLARSTMPHAAMLELVPSSLDSPPPPPGAASIAPRRVAPAVPPGFLPREALVTPATPRAAPATPAAPCVAPMTPASPAQHPGPPPLVWPSSPIAYIHRPCRPTAPATSALPTLTPAHRPVTRDIQGDIPWCILFADDVVLVDESRMEVDQKLELWR
jgi:hypothetical protein